MHRYQKLVIEMKAAGDPKRAQSQAAYMRNLFLFYGLTAKDRRAIYQPLIDEDKKKGMIDWALLEACYNQNYRELHSFVFDYLQAMEKYVAVEDFIYIKELFLKKHQWWDTIDGMVKLFGKVGQRDERVKEVMVIWAQDSDFWIRRTAILHQLGLKEKTDSKLLATIIDVNLGSDEFFINKAIGWALRDYSKTNPDWVRSFIKDRKNQLSSLSIREGSKYIKKRQ